MSANAPAGIRWTYARYAAGAAYPEDWIRIEESPGARLVANLPPYREADARAIVQAHNDSSTWYRDSRANAPRPTGESHV